MSDFIDAVTDAQYQLDRQDINPERAVIYTHPNTFEAAKDELWHIYPFGEGAEVNGCSVETTMNIPEGMVVLVHVDAAVIGENAIAFSVVE